MSKPKKMSPKEKVELYEKFFQRLHFHRFLSLDKAKEEEMLQMAFNLVNSQSSHIGGRLLTEEAVQERTNEALRAMEKLP